MTRRAGTSGRSRGPASRASARRSAPSIRALEDLVVAVGPGQHQRAAEARGPRLRRPRRLQRLPGPGHRLHEVAPRRRLRPVGGVDPGRAAERVDLDAAVVGERRQAARPRRGMRLDPGVAEEARLGLRRLRQAERRRRDHLDRRRRRAAPRSPRACRGCGSRPPAAARRAAGSCHRRPLRRDQRATPASARSISASSCAAAEGARPRRCPAPRSARRSSVITKLASVPATLSSA